MNAYNAVKTSLYGVLFEAPGVPEGAELVTEDTGKRRALEYTLTFLKILNVWLFDANKLFPERLESVRAHSRCAQAYGLIEELCRAAKVLASKCLQAIGGIRF